MTGIVKTDQIQGAQGTTVTIPSGQKLGIGTSSPNTIVDIAGDTSTLTLEDTSSHSANTGPAISFKSKDSGGTTREVAKIVGESHSGSNEGNLAFQTRNGGTLETKWKVFKNGNWLPSNSAYGIYLGTTSAADSNLLDDYEEGTFTPSWNGYASPHATSGSYTKIGNAVSVYVELVTANVTDTSEVQIDNLPFTISGNRGGGTVWHNRTSLYPYDILTVMNANTTGCKLNTVTASSNVVGIKYVDSGEPTLGGYTTLRWTIFYQTS
jgi:hypothetical protein